MSSFIPFALSLFIFQIPGVALDESTCMALELISRDIVVGVGVGVRPDRMGAAFVPDVDRLGYCPNFLLYILLWRPNPV